jgi:hypothetical protein
MTKKTTTKTKAAKAPKAAKPALEVRKDGKGRFWVVPKDGGKEQGPFDTRKAALDARATVASGASAPAAAPAKKAAKTKKANEPKAKKVSAIDAAAQVLASAKEPMNAKAMIEAMATKGLWTSPGGKTPHATLYSAIIREIALKGKESRFVKKDRGQFAAKA